MNPGRVEQGGNGREAKAGWRGEVTLAMCVCMQLCGHATVWPCSFVFMNLCVHELVCPCCFMSMQLWFHEAVVP